MSTRFSTRFSIIQLNSAPEDGEEGIVDDVDGDHDAVDDGEGHQQLVEVRGRVLDCSIFFLVSPGCKQGLQFNRKIYNRGLRFS